MASRDNVHSRLVAWLKILLPLAALGILSTLFLFSHEIDPSKAIRSSKVDVKQLASEPQVTMPDYAGMTRDGTSVTVSAAVAKPLVPPGTAAAAGADPTQPGAVVTQMRARFERRGGQTTTVDAATGSIDQGKGVMSLGGGVRIYTPDGSRIDARALTGLLDRTHLQSDGAVTSVGPLGRIDAGEMEITAGPGPNGQPGPYVLVFNHGVKLVYTPTEKGK